MSASIELNSKRWAKRTKVQLEGKEGGRTDKLEKMLYFSAEGRALIKTLVRTP